MLFYFVEKGKKDINVIILHKYTYIFSLKFIIFNKVTSKLVFLDVIKYIPNTKSTWLERKINIKG